MTDSRRDLRIAKNRFEALVDGIFAFAMTLLVTGLTIPHLTKTDAQATLAIRIASMRSEFISFLVAFFVLASFWQIHNRQMHFVRTVDSGLMRTTLFVLACVVLMPFTTNLSGDYSDVQVAVMPFHANMFAIGMLFFLQWRHLARTPDIQAVTISRRDITYGRYRSLIIPAVSAFGFALSFVSPSLSMAAYLLIIPVVAITRRYSR